LDFESQISGLDSGAVENLEVLFFSTRLLQTDLFELPATADLRLARTG
jgi:hypothetical protein